MRKPISMRIFSIIFLFFSSVLSCFSQQKVEGAIIAGASYYRGDLNEGNIVFDLVHPNFGAAIRYNVMPSFIIKLQAMFGSIAGDDKYTPNEAVRGAYFNNSYFSIGIAGEYLPLRQARFDGIGDFKKTWSPYLSFGIEFLQSADEVKCRYCGINNPNSLPEKDDKDTFIGLPFGLGARVDFHPNISIGAEVILQATFSDYLDGISKLGNDQRNDWIIGANFYVSYFFARSEPDFNFSTKK
ncbi:MAG TPA: DUF6089 family protein [Saprospiraceae bacterium]|nr:DUF6089 family protein [Saprospiraceae bacterium]